MRLIGRLLSVIIVLGTVASLCLPADAGAFSYAGKRKRIYCGIVGLATGLLDPKGNPTYVNQPAIDGVVPSIYNNLFAKLDAMTSMKPVGWTLENPLAATTDKYDPRYWIIPIASSRNLSRLDILYFPGAGTVSLTDEERENLRRFVDGGGVLWVDNAGQGSSALNFDKSGPFFIPQVGFATGATPGLDVPVSRHHPLVSTPNWLTDADVMRLGLVVTGTRWTPCHYGLPTVLATQPTSFDFLYGIVDSLDPDTGVPKIPSQPSVVANVYGSGRVVATANFVGCACLLQEPDSLPSLKLAYNIMAYASSWPDIRKSPRHTGAALDTLGSDKLVEKWSLQFPDGTENDKETAPIIYKNTVFYTHGDTLFALDANGDNNFGLFGPPDINGAVVIWKWTPDDGGRLSAPAIATVQNPADNAPCDPIEAVMVMSSTGGKVYVLPAFPISPDGIVSSDIKPLYDFTTCARPAAEPGSKWPSPPIYVNGWFYALGGDGRLYAQNPCLAKWSTNTKQDILGSPSSWQVPDPNPNSGYLAFTAIPRCGPAFGYMKGQYNGAVVGSVWWYNSRRTDPNMSHPLENDHLWAVPVTVSNDRVRVQSIDATRMVAELVSNFPGFLTAPDPRPGHEDSVLTMFASDGKTPLRINKVLLNQNTGGQKIPGYITVTTLDAIPASPRIYASYSLTYGAAASDLNNYTNIVAPTYSVEIEPKSQIGNGGTPDPAITHPETIIPGSPAMGPDNMIYLCGQRDTQTPLDGGSVLAYLNDGSSLSSNKLKWHYFLHSGLDAANGGAYAPGIAKLLPGVVRDTATDLSMKHPQPCSSPAISGGKVFVTVSGTGEGGSPAAALLCLKANPEFVIRLTTNGGYDTTGSVIKTPKSLWRQGNSDSGHYTVKIWQPNLINPASGAVPLMDARDVSGGATVDYDAGTITFSDFGQLKLQTRGGIETNTFSPSLPVWVYLDNVEVPIDWSTWGPGVIQTGPPLTAATSDSVDLSGWNNLLWYYVVPAHDGTPCTGVHSPPTVVGNTVYFICDDGTLYGLNTETGESKSQQTSQKPIWIQQLGNGSKKLTATSVVSVAGSNGVLMVPGPDGLHAFTSTSTLVADNNRLLELDGAGDVTWAADSITWPATIPPAPGAPMAVKQGPINKPGRTRYASTGEILFANTGANQVCKIDKSGMVGYDSAAGLYARWIYDSFADPRHLLSSGQPTKLRGPTDAIMWLETEPNTPSKTAPTYVVHCLIADSGNSRILDLVYRQKAGSFVKWDGTPIDPVNHPADMEYIDPDSKFVVPELNWVSKTDALNEKYSYNCMQLLPATRNGQFCQDIWVVSSDLASTGTDVAGGTSPMGGAGLGGAILSISYRERKPGSTTGIAGDWDYNQPDSGAVNARCDHVIMNGKSVPLANPRYFDVTDSPAPAGRSILICDNYGVYEISLSGTGTPPVMDHETIAGTSVPIYPLWTREYAHLLRLEDPTSTASSPKPPITLPGTPPLLATSAQRLPNHKWLIANGYFGSDRSGAQTFNGEVFEYDPAILPANQKVLWCSPRLEWEPVPPGSPLGAVPSVWKQADTNTYTLRQPRSATRQ